MNIHTNKFKCGVCFEAYSSHCRPKILPCYHTFCQSCLEKVAGTSTSFYCPLCRNFILLPPNGVESLQTNFYIEEDLTAAASLQTQPCDVCTEDREASFTCVECDQKFCLPCRKSHDAFSLSRGHTVTPLPQENVHGPGGAQSPTSEDKDIKEPCPKHPSQRLLLHCDRCGTDICIQCKLTQHEGHPTNDLEDFRAKAKARLRGRVDSVRCHREWISRLMKDLQDRNGRLLQHQQATEQGFKDRVDMVIQWVNQAQDEAVADVRSRTKELMKPWIEQIEQLQIADGELQTQQDDMRRVLEEGTEADIASMESQQRSDSNRLDRLDLKGLEKELAPDIIPPFHVNHDVSQVSLPQLRSFIGSLRLVQQSPTLEGSIASMLVSPVRASAGSTDVSPSRKSLEAVGTRKPSTELIYSEDPRARVVAMCPISHSRLWVMYSLGSEAAVSMKLFDVDGHEMTTVKDVQRCTGLVTLAGDKALAWVFDEKKRASQLIRPNGKVSDHNLGIRIGSLISSATNRNQYLRLCSNSQLHEVKFTETDQLTYSTVEVLSNRVSGKFCPGHVSAKGQYYAFIDEKKVHVCDKESILCTYSPKRYPKDIRFCQMDGREFLLVLVAGDRKNLHVVDHLEGGLFVCDLDTGPFLLQWPQCLATDFDRHVWVGCDGGKIVMVHL